MTFAEDSMAKVEPNQAAMADEVTQNNSGEHKYGGDSDISPADANDNEEEEEEDEDYVVIRPEASTRGSLSFENSAQQRHVDGEERVATAAAAACSVQRFVSTCGDYAATTPQSSPILPSFLSMGCDSPQPSPRDAGRSPSHGNQQAETNKNPPADLSVVQCEHPETPLPEDVPDKGDNTEMLQPGHVQSNDPGISPETVPDKGVSDSSAAVQPGHVHENPETSPEKSVPDSSAAVQPGHAHENPETSPEKSVPDSSAAVPQPDDDVEREDAEIPDNSEPDSDKSTAAPQPAKTTDEFDVEEEDRFSGKALGQSPVHKPRFKHYLKLASSTENKTKSRTFLPAQNDLGAPPLLVLSAMALGAATAFFFAAEG